MHVLATRIRQIEQGFSGSLLSQCRTDRGGPRIIVFVMSEKVRIFAHGNARNRVPIQSRILRSFFDVSPIFPPNIFYITDNQRMFNTPPRGTETTKSHDFVVFFASYCFLLLFLYSTEVTIDVSTLPQGVYMLQYTSQRGSATTRYVVQ